MRWGEAYDFLAEHLPPEALAEFIGRYGGRMMRVPRRLRESRRQLTARVLSTLRVESYDATAEQVGVSRSTVVRVSRETC